MGREREAPVPGSFKRKGEWKRKLERRLLSTVGIFSVQSHGLLLKRKPTWVFKENNYDTLSEAELEFFSRASVTIFQIFGYYGSELLQVQNFCCFQKCHFWKEEQNVFPQINSKTHNLRIIFLIFIWSDSFFLINHRGIKASSKYHIQIFISLHKLRNQCLRKNWKYWFFINFRNIFE